MFVLKFIRAALNAELNDAFVLGPLLCGPRLARNRAVVRRPPACFTLDIFA